MKSDARRDLVRCTGGRINDFMIGKKIGGVNVFGGGLVLYNAQRKVIVGVSGDTSCADHMIGWRVRNNLMLDWLPVPNGGVEYRMAASRQSSPVTLRISTTSFTTSSLASARAASVIRLA